MEGLLEALDARPFEWSRVAPWAAAIAVVVGLGAWQVTAQSRVQRACRSSAEVKNVWGEDARASVRAAFGAINRPFASAALASVERALDAYAAALYQHSLAACEAALVRREASEETYLLQTSCFNRRRAELSELVKTLSTAEETTVERAGTGAWSLTPASICANPARVRADPRLSNAALTRVGVDALQATLMEARAALEAGKLKSLEPLVEKAQTDARRVGLKALEAEAASLAAGLQQAQGKNAEAAESWRRTAMLAHASGFDELLALASVRLATNCVMKSCSFVGIHA